MNVSSIRFTTVNEYVSGVNVRAKILLRFLRWQAVSYRESFQTLHHLCRHVDVILVRMFLSV